MAENDNNNGRPVKASPGARPAETLVTNNNNGRVISNENYANKQPIRKSNDSTPTQTPTKKGK